MDGDAIYSLTTTTGQGMGLAAHEIPPAASFPFPYAENFDSYAEHSRPRYFTDISGTFEAVTEQGPNCLKQAVAEEGLLWNPSIKPYTIVGDMNWTDYAVSSDVFISGGNVAIGGKWGEDPNLGLPRVTDLGVGNAIRLTSYSVDPFDPNFQASVENADSSALSASQNDKWLIGYVFENEGGWDDAAFQAMLNGNHTMAAKNAFVDSEMSINGNSVSNLNILFGTTAPSSAALKDSALDAGKVPAADKSAFIRAASVQYYSKIRNALRDRKSVV
jgi:hypothetical protein